MKTSFLPSVGCDVSKGEIRNKFSETFLLARFSKTNTPTYSTKIKIFKCFLVRFNAITNLSLLGQRTIAVVTSEC